MNENKDHMEHAEQQSEYLILAQKVLHLSRNVLMVNLRYMAAAVSRLVLTAYSMETIGTDGYHFFYSPLFLLHSYKNNQNCPVRFYLHCLLHCIFRHMFVNSEIDRTLWNLACDISAENTIMDLDLRSVKESEDTTKQIFLNNIKKDISILTAEKIYSWLLSNHNHDDYCIQLSEVFTMDDHQFWYVQPERKDFISMDSCNSEDSEKEDSGCAGEIDKPGNIISELVSRHSFSETADPEMYCTAKYDLAELWKQIAVQVKTAEEMMNRRQGTGKGSLVQNLKAVTRERYDYTAFLKKFAVINEEMKLNDEEFDYIFYTYGLSQYGNMPLIEPLEYKDSKRIREFVIAIDTSGSVSGKLVQTFVTKTYNILKSTESFFSRINLHIIQCDEVIQEDVRITNQEDFDDYMKNMHIRGFGGTDFRPVFSYVDRLAAEGEFTNLRGLIYFTDGMGTYPEQMPNYETAFVFIDDEFNNPNVPPWAMKLVLQRDEI